MAGGQYIGNTVHARLRADPIQQLADAAGVLREQASVLGLKRTACQIVLAPELYTLSLIERPDVDDSEVVEAVRWRMQENVEFPMDQASLDVFEMPDGATRDRRMVFVVAIHTELLKRILDKVYDAGLETDVVDVAELALRNIICDLFPEPDQGIALLRVTSNSGMINVSRGEALFLSRRISGVPGEFSVAAWESFQERLLLQVQRSIDYYESAMGQPPCNALLVAATHGWQENICAYLADMLAVPVRPLTDELAPHYELELFNPSAKRIDWSNLTVPEANALAAALPTFGGVLRGLLGKPLDEAA